MALHALKPQAKQSEAETGHHNHGGAREGAGRKPKALRYADELAASEEKIIAALPDVIDALISAAKAGDVAASRYLLDRVFGRVKEQAAPPADDTALPPCEADVESAEREADVRRACGW
jgi:hypothetical protein